MELCELVFNQLSALSQSVHSGMVLMVLVVVVLIDNDDDEDEDDGDVDGCERAA